MKTVSDQSAHSAVTDPIALHTVDEWREVLRILKPGGHLLSFANTQTYHRMVVAIEDAGFEIRDQIGWMFAGVSCIRPTWESIAVARKPLDGTVAANVLLHGTGGLNIDACRVPSEKLTGWGGARGGSDDPTQSRGRNYRLNSGDPRPVDGRWPANVLHDGSDEVLESFARFGEKTSGKPCGMRKSVSFSGIGTSGLKNVTSLTGYGDTGSIARFYYAANKPISLMRYLCRLVTPPGGTVLDPFGSGIIRQAADAEGFNAIVA